MSGSPSNAVKTPPAASATTDSAPTNHIAPTTDSRPLHVLASLLATTSAELDATKKLLAETERKSLHLEALVKSLQIATTDTTRDSSHTLIVSLHDKISHLTQQRDDEIARRLAINDLWSQLKDYLALVDRHSLDARLGFDKVIQAGGGELVLAPIHPVSDVDLRRHYRHHETTRRPRADSSSYPIAKRPRTGYQPHPDTIQLEPQPQPQFSYLYHGRSHDREQLKRARSRSSSRSSVRSMDVDEMLLQASTSRPSNQPSPHDSQRHQRYPDDHHTTHPSYNNHYSHPHGNSHPSHRRPDANRYPDSPPYPSPSKIANHYSQARPHDQSDTALGNVYPASHSMDGISRTQPYQTHTFAPVVTGAPVKKGKYSSLTSIGTSREHSIGKLVPDSVSRAPISDMNPTPSTHSFPPTNSLNQRICRQCGVAGRYKDGKCVEKWGPGPLGPGTVCDRCRKKMKRVERRGTLESTVSQPVYPSIPPSEPPARSATLHWERDRELQPQNFREHPALLSHPQRLAPLQLGPSGTHLDLRSSYPSSPVSDHNGRSHSGPEPAVSSVRASPIGGSPPARVRSRSEIRVDQPHSPSPSIRHVVRQNGNGVHLHRPSDDDGDADLQAAVDAAEELSTHGSVKDEDR